MTYKQWTGYEVLTSADMNALSDQSVMVFDDATARTAALPSPTEGMISYLKDTDELQVYDGSAWATVTAGSPYPNVWTLGTASTQSSLTFPSTSTAKNTWTELTASLGVDAVVHGVQMRSNNNATHDLDIGTGASGSEVIRWSYRNNASQFADVYFPIPYGIGVANGTRLAFRYGAVAAGPFNYTVTLWYTPTASALTAKASGIIQPVTPSGTAWVQLGATPPSTDCFVVAFHGDDPDSIADVKYQFGLGASGSEISASGYLNLRGQTVNGNGYRVISPIAWPSGTRLAFRTDNANAGSGGINWNEKIGVIWRETLT